MLAIDKLIILILGIIVLVAVVFLIYSYGKGTADQLFEQNSLRACCGAYRAALCTLPDSITCDNQKTVGQMESDLGMDKSGLDRFCDCTTVSST
jgi:hypothetical protein